MAIDRRLYEKVTGRLPGDADIGRAVLASARSKRHKESVSESYLKGKIYLWWMSMGATLILGLILLFSLK